MIENGKEAIYEENKVEEQDVILLLDRFGYAKTVDVATYERNKEAADSENKHIVPCKNTGKVCTFYEYRKDASGKSLRYSIWKVSR